ncbi:MAG TPA: IclR family transcriptional regulator [Acidimicrobiales bacterium]
MPNNVETVDQNRYQVQSVARAATLLNEIANKGAGGMSVTQIAERLGVAKSTALALARTLATAGLLRSVDPGPRYVLGLNLLRLGDLVGQQTSIGELGLPTLRLLSSVTGLTARMAMNEGGYPVFIERIDGEGSIRFHASLGQREEPHATAAGKAILAHLDVLNVRTLLAEAGMARYTSKTLTDVDSLLLELERVRSEGFALDDEEEAEGVMCVGSAFFDHKGVCVGALSVTGLKVDVPLREVRALGITVREHADRISTMLGGTRPKCAS